MEADNLIVPKGQVLGLRRSLFNGVPYTVETLYGAFAHPALYKIMYMGRQIYFFDRPLFAAPREPLISFRFLGKSIPQGLKPIDFAAFMARLKPCPFKTTTCSEVS